jgi:branched-chain amino acid transport system permease protein
MGLGIRATGTDAYMAALAGMKLTRTRMLAWALSAGITGIAGFLVAPLMLSSPLMGLPVVVNGFIAAIIGGFGNPLAAVVGGVVLGLLIQFFTGYISAGFGELLVFIALILVLAFRPQGIMGVIE